MPQCSVPGCVKQGGHRFPRDPKLQKAWVKALKRCDSVNRYALWKPTKEAKVCHRHFDITDYEKLNKNGMTSKKRVLKPNAVPSKGLPHQSSRSNKERIYSKLRALKAGNTSIDSELPPLNAGNTSTKFGVATKQNGNTTPDEPSVVGNTTPDEPQVTQQPLHASSATQTYLSGGAGCTQLMGFDKLDDRAVEYYTGFSSRAKFEMVLQSLGEQRFKLQYFGYARFSPLISISDQFLLTLIKLRCHPPNIELSINFGMNEKQVRSVFVTWINFMYIQWSEVQWWPDKHLVSSFAPDEYKMEYPHTRVILGDTEVPLQSLANPPAQHAAAFSAKRNRNTLKVVVGATPGGLISYVSDAYGGTAAPRQIVERSDLMDLIGDEDELMVDREFDCDDVFKPSQLRVNMRIRSKKKNGTPSETVTTDRKIAPRTNHMERLIGLGKKYKILTQSLNSVECRLATRIISVCFWLCNFRHSTVSKPKGR